MSQNIRMVALIGGQEVNVGRCHPGQARILRKQGVADWQDGKIILKPSPKTTHLGTTNDSWGLLRLEEDSAIVKTGLREHVRNTLAEYFVTIDPANELNPSKEIQLVTYEPNMFFRRLYTCMERNHVLEAVETPEYFGFMDVTEHVLNQPREYFVISKSVEVTSHHVTPLKLLGLEPDYVLELLKTEEGRSNFFNQGGQTDPFFEDTEQQDLENFDWSDVWEAPEDISEQFPSHLAPRAPADEVKVRTSKSNTPLITALSTLWDETEKEVLNDSVSQMLLDDANRLHDEFNHALEIERTMFDEGSSAELDPRMVEKSMMRNDDVFGLEEQPVEADIRNPRIASALLQIGDRYPELKEAIYKILDPGPQPDPEAVFNDLVNSWETPPNVSTVFSTPAPSVCSSAAARKYFSMSPTERALYGTTFQDAVAKLIEEDPSLAPKTAGANTPTSPNQFPKFVFGEFNPESCTPASQEFMRKNFRMNTFDPFKTHEHKDKMFIFTDDTLLCADRVDGLWDISQDPWYVHTPGTKGYGFMSQAILSLIEWEDSLG